MHLLLYPDASTTASHILHNESSSNIRNLPRSSYQHHQHHPWHSKDITSDHPQFISNPTANSPSYLSNPNMKFTPILHHPEPINFKSFLQHAHHPTAIYQLLPTSTNQGQHTTQMTTITMAIHPRTHQPNTHILFIDLHTLGLQSFYRVFAIDYPTATHCLIQQGHHLYTSTLSPVSCLQWNP